MHRHPSGSGRPALMIGLGLTAVAATTATLFLTRRHQHGSTDSAPGFTARRSTHGGYDVVGRSVTIRRPRAELFAFWRDFSNLADFMENLNRVEPAGSGDTSTWFIKGPMGKTLAIETRIAREIDGELIAWRSTENAEFATEGRVTFEDAPGDRGTRVGLIIAYRPPAGAIGKAIATLSGREPQMQARHDLKRFKMLMETGEIATSARQKENV